MFDEPLSAGSLAQIHDTTMRLLEEVGVAMPQDEAVATFNHHGFKVDSGRVFITETQVFEALKVAPEVFILDARNAARSVTIGGDSSVFAPAYGAPFLVDSGRAVRMPTLDDYRDIVRIVHELPNMDVMGYLMVQPDMPVAHLHMVHAALTHSDKPIIGSAAGAEGAAQTLDMARIAFGGDLADRRVAISIVSSLCPLGYAPDMLDVLLTYAKAGQPMVIASVGMAGTTAPITLAGLLAQQSAEVLAGITLAQLVHPGVPVVFGSTGSSTDMRTGSLSIGSPELSMIIAAHAQLARYYRLPSRAGGSLTDASFPDAQSGFESMMSLKTTVDSGVSFVLHAGGALSSWMAFSYEKLVLDDEMCSMVRRLTRGIEVTPDTLALDVIKSASRSGDYLRERHTLKRSHTEFWRPALCERSGLAAWEAGGGTMAVDRAQARWQALLETHVDPDMDANVRRALDDYVAART